MNLTLLESAVSFGGQQQRWRHDSKSCQGSMTFSIYLPSAAVQGSQLPVLYWLSGLTCTDQNFTTKAGAQRIAAELGLILVMPDTSPRGDEVADVAERYDLGQGAGFYVDASAEPWRQHFQMYSYVTSELPALIEANFPAVAGLRSISGHSMGGHGALVCALRNPEAYRSVSAFAPICRPSACPWGQGCLSTYLGDDRVSWGAYDAWELLNAGKRPPSKLLIDQGEADPFLAEQLQSPAFAAMARGLGVEVDFHLRPGYDHSYYHISSFIQQHLEFHAQHLQG